MVIYLMAGGPSDLIPHLGMYKDREGCIWVGVDRGVQILLDHGITPAAAFGDFDSVTEDELSVIQEKLDTITIYPSEKDETDLEIAFKWAVAQDPQEIWLFGSTGGRIDHFLGNIQLFLREEILPLHNKISFYMADHKNLLTVKTPGSYSLQVMDDKKYISLIPVIGNADGISLHGFKYPLQNSYLPVGSTRCISNELISEIGNYSFTSGILLVIRSSD